MVNSEFYDGFEEEGQIFIYDIVNRQKNGILIWQGYFELLLDVCWYPHFYPNGLISSYHHCNGFYDMPTWHMKDLKTAIEELQGFHSENVKTDSLDFRETVEKLRDALISFLEIASLIIGTYILNITKVLFRNRTSLLPAEGFDLKHSANRNLMIYFVTVPYRYKSIIYSITISFISACAIYASPYCSFMFVT